MERGRASLAGDLVHVGRGLLMGAADIVPGVSGGTVALILGIYERLVTAISRFDLEAADLVRRGAWREAAEHVDLRFLVALGAGIGIGLASLAGLMHYLLEHEMSATFGAFFGLILASSLIVARLVERWGAGEIAGAAAGAAFAYWLTGLVPAQADMSYGYLFLCGMIAICAMILPGISGAFVLLILGVYYDVTGVLKGLAAGDVTVAGVLVVVVFAAGAATGLLGFSKLLRWLLEHFHSKTMAVLCGFMLGSLRRIWPFKVEIGFAPGREFRDRVFANVAPWNFDGGVVAPLLLCIAGIALVLALERIGSDRRATAS